MRRSTLPLLVVSFSMASLAGCASGGAPTSRTIDEAPADAGAQADAPSSPDAGMPSPVTMARCGDLTCDLAETCASCTSDCGPCPARCGDGRCEPSETDCPRDCGDDPADDFCGDGTCQARETCASCSSDCGACAPRCGDAICTPGVETCGTCSRDCGPCP